MATPELPPVDVPIIEAVADEFVASVVAGANVTVDDTDPSNPIVSASAGGSGFPVETSPDAEELDVVEVDVGFGDPVEAAYWRSALDQFFVYSISGRVESGVASPYMGLVGYQGDAVTPTPMLVDDVVGVLTFAPWWDAVLGLVGGDIEKAFGVMAGLGATVRIQAVALENHTDMARGTALDFLITPEGATAPVSVARWLAEGLVTPQPYGTLDTNVTTTAAIDADNQTGMIVDTSGAASTVTLPDVSITTGRTFMIVDSSGDAAANNITIQDTGAVTVDVINVNRGTSAWLSDGIDWLGVPA